MFILPTLYSRGNVSVVPKAVCCAKKPNFLVCSMLPQLFVQDSLTESLFLQVVTRSTVFTNYCIYVFRASLGAAFSHTSKRALSGINSTVSENHAALRQSKPGEQGAKTNTMCFQPYIQLLLRVSARKIKPTLDFQSLLSKSHYGF